MPVLFISDLHLSEERPRITARFVEFLKSDATQAHALYILGDLFEAWVGDDAIAHEPPNLIAALRALTARGVPVYVMHGNRDFLLGEGFAKETGCQLLPDPAVIDLFGTRTLLMHGDTLCTDDVAYQQFRAQVRDARWQHQFLALPLAVRQQTAQQYRAESKKYTREKSEEIMDVNQATVESTLRSHGVTRLIHGHTHRPGVHRFTLGTTPVERIVLGDWYEQGSVLRCDARHCTLESLSIS